MIRRILRAALAVLPPMLILAAFLALIFGVSVLTGGPVAEGVFTCVFCWSVLYLMMTAAVTVILNDSETPR